MSKNLDFLVIDKYVTSRLWYTASAILILKIYNRYLKHSISNKPNDLHEVISSSLASTVNREQFEWTIHKLLLLLNQKKNKKIQETLKIIQFFTILKIIDHGVSKKIKEELFEVFQAVTQAEKEKSLVSSIISSSTLQFLETNLYLNPAFTCELINSLFVLPTLLDSSNFILQDACSKSFKAFLTSNKITEKMKSLLCILSKFEVIPFKKNKVLSLFYFQFFNQFNLDEIELSLYSRKNAKFLKEWHAFYDNQKHRLTSINNVEDVKKVNEILFLLNNTNFNKKLLEAKELTLRVVNRKCHWFSDLLNVCTILVENGEYDETTRILSFPILRNIWSLLLLNFLDYLLIEEISLEEDTHEKSIIICESINFLLNKSRSVQYESNELIFLNLNAFLSSNLNVIIWVLNYRKKHSFSKCEMKLLIKQIVNNLQQTCILSVLKKSINLHKCNFVDVKNLLKGREEIIKIFKAYLSMRTILNGITTHKTEKEVIDVYEELESMLNMLNPVTLRIEVIENIFSMLFLRSDEHFIKSKDFSGQEYETTAIKKNIHSAYKSKEFDPHKEYGFICHKFIVKKLLHHLKKCVFQVGIDFAKLRRETQSTDKVEMYGKNIYALDNMITDACWRLELVTSPKCFENKKGNNNHYNIFSSKFDSAIDEKLCFLFSQKSKSIFYNHQLQSSSEEGNQSVRSDVDGSSETSSIDANCLNRRKKRVKNYSSSITMGCILNNINSKYIINLMLSSKESLVLQCLWKADYARAQQIIEMFKMKNTTFDGHVRFSKAMLNFRVEIEKQMNLPDKIDSPNIYSEELQIYENFRRAAQGGYQNSRVANLLETFVSSQDPIVRLLSSDVLETHEVITLCVLDFALTIGQSYQTSTSLIDVAAKYIKLSQRLDGTRHAVYFCEICRLLNDSRPTVTLPYLLSNATIPLALRDWKKNTEFWCQLLKQSEKFLSFQTLSDKFENDINSEKLISKGQKHFREIITLCGNVQSYLHKILAYLQILHSFVLCVNQTSFPTESILFTNSIDFYLGHQIFNLNVKPENLEIVANKLGVSLVYNILINCCPKLTCYNSLNSITSKAWGYIVLNENLRSLNDLHSTQIDPNQFVASILLELLIAFKRLYPNRTRLSNKDLDELSKDVKIQEILNKSTKLKSLNLSELLVGDHTLAFFLNLWNLLFLHAQIRVWITDPPINSLKKYISLSSIAYRVGDLGYISLAILRHKLLGSMSWDAEFFSQTENLYVWKDLNLTKDPRVIFAMANEFFETPVIRVYYPQTLNKDLNEGLYDYINNYVTEVSHDTYEQIMKMTEFLKIIQDYEISSNENILNSNFNIGNINQLYENIFPKKITRKYGPVTDSYNVLLKYNKSNLIKINLNLKRIIKSGHHSSIWATRSIKSNVLYYLEGHCWILSYLVKRIHEGNLFRFENGCDNQQRTVCFENNFSSPWNYLLARALFNHNLTITSIQENLSLEDLWIHFEKCLEDNQLVNCLDVINALPNKILTKYTEVQFLRDKILSQLIQAWQKVRTLDLSFILQYIFQIKDVNVLVQTVIANFNKWPVHLSQNSLIHVLHHVDKEKLPSYYSSELNETLRKVAVFCKILPYYKSKNLNNNETTYYDVLNCIQKTDPVDIIQSLINARKFELCIEWLEYQTFFSENQSLVTPVLLIGLLKNDETDFKSARKLLFSLPTKQSIKLCKSVMIKLESISAMRFLIDYILENCETHEAKIYYKIQISVEILSHLESKEITYYISLLKEPLLILEQLLMNCKFENLRKILNFLQRSNNFEKADISIKSFDEIVRFYAGKTLDFRVCLKRDGIDPKIKNFVALPNILENEIRRTEFMMPVNVPTREEWIPNDQARECNCCRAVIFSMFNRRHHCRRCGRVICAACSQQRMQIPKYPQSVMVRVCNDCKVQTIQMQTAQATSSTSCSAASEIWKLTTDEKHIQTVREEFSFEYAPHISSCLAILSLHSDHKAYASFLLDRCDEMKRLLQPGTGGRVNPEIDHALIIKMIRSLLVAVKVKCAKLGLNTGLAHCDRFLSQVDLIATLVQSDCLSLIPSDDSLDEYALRKLRDLLTEKEQWTLALDVSTKSGLDAQGVWAAWGKACLKAGYFDRARTKFAHCLEKVLYKNLDDWVLVSFPDSECSIKSNEDSIDVKKPPKLYSIKSESPNLKRLTGKIRPNKNPPLLLEILQMLENQSQLNQNLSSSLLFKSNVSQEILITMNTLKTVSQGQCSLVHNWNFRSIYYEESLYYLLSYGSFNSILEFFIKYEEFDKCLTFVIENNVEPDLFFHVLYLRCLNIGNTGKLLEIMRAKDPSLLIWKKYLVYTCHSLERKQLLHTLYYLQLLMKDFIRAAMTCIHFYKTNTKNYTELCSKSHYLIEAQKHLETKLNVKNISNTHKQSITLSGSLNSGLTMEMEPPEIDKHINTISRQLEITKFLSSAEKEGRTVNIFLKHLLELDTDNINPEELPTLFGNQQQKTRLAVLAILCGRDAEEGFGIAYRIIQDYNLKPQKVYSLAGHILAVEKKIPFIEQLIRCCRSSGAPGSQNISDRVLTHCVKLLLQNSQTELNSELTDRVDCLIGLINDVELKISSYVGSKQLKAAYLLAVKHRRAQDIKKILKEADRLGQSAITSICTKWLRQTSNVP